jgi:4-aminobutyrate aminotransferase
MDNAAQMGSHMLERLGELRDRHEAIGDVRGLGLMIGVELVRDRETLQPWPELRDRVVVECFNRGLVIQGAGETSVRFSPPLIVSKEQADFALVTFEASLEASLAS